MRFTGFLPLLLVLLWAGCVSPKVANDDGAPGLIAHKGDNTNPLRRRDEEFFSVCFADPELAPPPEKVTSRVLEQTHGQQRDLTWKRAIISHESGGDPQAVSATGCTGLFAISPQHLAGPACCVHEAEDALEFIYDVCNSEAVNGYHCDRNRDPRFIPGVSFEIADRLLDQFRHLRGAEHGPSAVDHQEYLLALPIFWNAGPKVISDFPKNMNSVGNVLSRLDFRRDTDYNRWRTYGLVNKWVEIFDYIRWFDFLTQFWKQQGMSLASRSPQNVALPKFNCAIYDPDKLFGGSRIYFGLSRQQQQQVQTAFQKVRIKRLRYGQYLEEFAYVGNRAESGRMFFNDDVVVSTSNRDQNKTSVK
ncbi:MAG: lytic transglycosylase domain-containing protein [Bdellovibrionales bacterium]|nr:lytic transglycosylase domain-containing protein [Bdellovibrionales bacterium]